MLRLWTLTSLAALAACVVCFVRTVPPRLAGWRLPVLVGFCGITAFNTFTTRGSSASVRNVGLTTATCTKTDAPGLALVSRTVRASAFSRSHSSGLNRSGTITNPSRS